MKNFLSNRQRKLKNIPFGVFKIKDDNGFISATVSDKISSATCAGELYDHLTSPSSYIWYTGDKEIGYIVKHLEDSDIPYTLVGKDANGLRIGTIEIRNTRHLLARDIDDELKDKNYPVNILAKAIYGSVANVIKDLRETFNVEPAYSPGRTAVAIMESMLPEGHTYSHLNAKAEKFIDNFRFGGMYYFQYKGKKIENAVTIDRKAAYAEIMRGEFPVRKSVSTRKYRPGVIGFYECDIDYPDNLFPLIPSKNNRNQVQYVTGKFRSYVTNETIEFFSSHGVKFDVIKGEVFPVTERPFTTLIDKFEEAEAKASPVFKKTVKAMRTSLTGTLGTRRVSEVRKAGYAIIGQKQMVDKDNNIIPEHMERITIEEDFIMPHWYCLITSRQRIELARILFNVNKEDILRVATDSFTVPKSVADKLLTSNIVNISNSYGDYKIEHEWDWTISWDTMEYEGFDGSYVYKCNGVPQKAKVEENKLRWSSISTPVNVARTGNLTITRSRMLPNRYASVT